MKIGIVGWGLEAQSAYHYFGPEHEYLIVNETAQDNFPAESDKVKLQYLQTEAPIGIGGQVTDLSYLKGIELCDKIVYQPTAYFNLKKALGGDQNFWHKATTVYDIFFENTPTKNIIGVTGTKGKGTTSTLIAKMLEVEGKRVHLGGNIGTPILDLLPKLKTEDWVVWELANFQLKPASYSPHIAVCLMVVPEHMDWHPNMKDYMEAKANIFRHQKNDDIAIYFAENEPSKKIATYSPGKKVPYFQKPGAFVREDGMIVIGEDEKEVINKSEVKLLGEHNLQNVCAAATAVFEALGSLDKAKAVLSSFRGLEHRLELVREFEGVKYYNDSFAATPDAAIGAIKAITGKKIMIMGGFDRNLSLSHLAQAVADTSNRVRQVFLIGQSAQRFSKELSDAGFKNYSISQAKTMPEIVSAVQKEAQTGDSVVLSPGFPSFDMFKNFTDRGQKYKTAIEAL